MTYRTRRYFSTITAALLSVVFLTYCAVDEAAAQSQHHLLYTPEDVEWQDGPPSLEPGAEFAVLEGDPSAEEVFTLRLKMPDGYHISPHWHPNVERVTVLSGSFLLGSGADLDRNAVTVLEPGSYVSLPPETQHYAIMDGETVIQLTSVGPWVINYVDDEDDPRLRSEIGRSR